MDNRAILSTWHLFLNFDNPGSLTLTDVPGSEDGLIQLLERAIVSGNRSSTRLTEIYLPMQQYPAMGSQFWHVPVEDTGQSNVLRLVFEG